MGYEGLSISNGPSSSVSGSMTNRRVEINKDGAGNVFAATGLGEKRLVGATGADFVGDAGIVTTIRAEAVLKQVPVETEMSMGIDTRQNFGNSDVQLPGRVTELNTSLAEMDMTDLTIDKLVMVLRCRTGATPRVVQGGGDSVGEASV